MTASAADRSPSAVIEVATEPTAVLIRDPRGEHPTFRKGVIALKTGEARLGSFVIMVRCRFAGCVSMLAQPDWVTPLPLCFTLPLPSNVVPFARVPA